GRPGGAPSGAPSEAEGASPGAQDGPAAHAGEWQERVRAAAAGAGAVGARPAAAAEARTCRAVSARPDLAERVREFAARSIEGYEVEAVPRPWGHSVYVRWESRGVKRALELQLGEADVASVDVWATASKARKDRSLKLASLPAPAEG